MAKKGDIDLYLNKEFEALLNAYGPGVTAEIIGATEQGVQKNFKKRKGIKKTQYILPDD